MSLTYLIILGTLLLAISVIDIWKRQIPNYLITLGFGLAIGFNLDNPEVLKSSAFGMLIMFALFILFYAATKKIGGGDVKLAALAGFIVGFPNMPFIIFMIGISTVVINLMFYQRDQFKSDFPYAPVLAIGSIITIVFGNKVSGLLGGL